VLIDFREYERNISVYIRSGNPEAHIKFKDYIANEGSLIAMALVYKKWNAERLSKRKEKTVFRENPNICI
jgi:hypothetical protein